MQRVLLADADLSVRSALALLLKHKLGVTDIREVGEVRSLEEAMDSFKPDLLLLDEDLPGFDIRGLRGHLSQFGFSQYGRPCAVVVMSMQAENEQRALACGADAFLYKRASGDYVLKVLNRYIRN